MKRLLVRLVGLFTLLALSLTADAGGAGPPPLDASPNRVNFGRVSLFSNPGLFVTITNKTTTNFGTGTYTFGGTNPSSVFVVDTEDSNCDGASSGPTSGFTVGLAPGASCDFLLRFTPTVEQRYVSTLTATWNGLSVGIEVPMAGRGISP